jgi:hypothetical protein
MRGSECRIGRPRSKAKIIEAEPVERVLKYPVQILRAQVVRVRRGFTLRGQSVVRYISMSMSWRGLEPFLCCCRMRKTSTKARLLLLRMYNTAVAIQ